MKKYWTHLKKSFSYENRMRIDNIAAWIIIPAVFVGYFTKPELGIITGVIFFGLAVVFHVLKRKYHLDAVKKAYEKHSRVGIESDAYKRTVANVLARFHESDTAKVLFVLQFLISLKEKPSEFEKEIKDENRESLPNYNVYETLSQVSECFPFLQKMADQFPFSEEWLLNLTNAMKIAGKYFEKEKTE